MRRQHPTLQPTVANSPVVHRQTLCSNAPKEPHTLLSQSFKLSIVFKQTTKWLGYKLRFWTGQLQNLGSEVLIIWMSHWCHTMVDGAELWINCQWPAFLSILSRWQLIQNSAPSTIVRRQCNIRIQIGWFFWKMKNENILTWHLFNFCCASFIKFHYAILFVGPKYTQT